VTTSVEFWTIEVSRRWMISDARSAAYSDWLRSGARKEPIARETSPFICSAPRPECARKSAPIHIP
jgi:hypothetical protein